MWLAALIGAGAALLHTIYKWLIRKQAHKKAEHRHRASFGRVTNEYSLPHLRVVEPTVMGPPRYNPLPKLPFAPQAIPFSLYCDALIGKSANVFVQSFSSSNSKYHVSLANQTCTCPDFAQSRHDCPENHFSRWCKHIIHVGNENNAFANCDRWHEAIAKEGEGGPVSAYMVSVSSGQQFLTAVGANRVWINVFVKTALRGQMLPHLSGPIRKFGWNILEKRWSYGVAPRGAREMRKLLVQIEGINEGQRLM